MPLFFVVNINYFYCQFKIFLFSVSSVFDHAAITRSDLMPVLHVLRQDHLDLLIGGDVSDAGGIHSHVHAISVYFDMFLISATNKNH